MNSECPTLEHPVKSIETDIELLKSLPDAVTDLCGWATDHGYIDKHMNLWYLFDLYSSEENEPTHELDFTFSDSLYKATTKHMEWDTEWTLSAKETFAFLCGMYDAYRDEIIGEHPLAPTSHRRGLRISSKQQIELDLKSYIPAETIALFNRLSRPLHAYIDTVAKAPLVGLMRMPLGVRSSGALVASEAHMSASMWGVKATVKAICAEMDKLKISTDGMLTAESFDMINNLCLLHRRYMLGVPVEMQPRLPHFTIPKAHGDAIITTKVFGAPGWTNGHIALVGDPPKKMPTREMNGLEDVANLIDFNMHDDTYPIGFSGTTERPITWMSNGTPFSSHYIKVLYNALGPDITFASHPKSGFSSDDIQWKNEPIVVKKDGKHVAVLMPVFNQDQPAWIASQINQEN